MKISLFLNKDLESNIALNCLLPTLRQHQFNIYLSEKVGKELSIAPLQHLAFLEREFPNKYLFPQLEQAPTDGFLSFNQINEKLGIFITTTDTLEASLDDISAFQPDLFVSIRFGKIFKGKVLSVPPLGIVNLHSAILPHYKGVLGTFRSILNGDKKIGSTLHYITDSGIDTGKIIHISEQNISPDKSVLWHIINLYPQACAQLGELIHQLNTQKEIQSTRQQGSGNYYTFPTQEDFDRLKDSKIELYNLDEYTDIITACYKVDRKWVEEVIKASGHLRLR
ncbi:MAG: formyl transferase [Cyclobacteriaceae bacterium]